jgi:hypothetical protein
MNFLGGTEENCENTLGATAIEEQNGSAGPNDDDDDYFTLFPKLYRLYGWKCLGDHVRKAVVACCKSGPTVSIQYHYVIIDLMTRVNDLYLLSLL